MEDIVYSIIDLTDSIRKKYEDFLRPEITSIIMLQSPEDVWLESEEIEIGEGGWEKKTIRRINLDFIRDADMDTNSNNPMFNPIDPIETNAAKLVEELGPYSICNVTDLFMDEACERISKKWNTFGKE